MERFTTLPMTVISSKSTSGDGVFNALTDAHPWGMFPWMPDHPGWGSPPGAWITAPGLWTMGV